MIRVAVLSAINDICPDGSASVWEMKDGRELNVEYQCSCIYKMLSRYQLFLLFMDDSGVFFVKKKIFNQYCAKK